MTNGFYELFNNKKPLIGMIHLAGDSEQERINRALEEISIFEEEGIAGALIEDYQGSITEVVKTLDLLSLQEPNIVIGINILRNPYSAFEFANQSIAKFIQFDSVQEQDLDLEWYDADRRKYPRIVVLGGIRFKYTGSTGNSLKQDLKEGVSRCEAIVTTGEGTGIETPIQKLHDFKKILKEFPLIVGAGVNKDNIKEQLEIADGAIIGSYFKDYNTQEKIKRHRVRELVQVMKS